MRNSSHKGIAEAIERILLPEEYWVGNLSADDTAKMEKWRRRVNDVQHLTAHAMARHDVFVTSDEDDMLKKRDRLREEAGIVVLDPEEVVRLVRRSGERGPLPGRR